MKVKFFAHLTVVGWVSFTQPNILDNIITYWNLGAEEMFDYYLDGYFIKCEECRGNFPVCGHYWVIALDNRSKVVTQVVEIEQISDTEILLSSC